MSMCLPIVPATTVDGVPPADFVAAMSRAATGVTIITTDGEAGRFGLTVSAFSSVSAEPPLVLACVNRRSPLVEAVARNLRFAVNVLADDQSPVAMTFAGRPGAGAAYAFSDARWFGDHHGQPVLRGAAAVFSCDLHSHMDAGTHRIFIGHVRAAIAGSAQPLVHAVRDFRRAAPLS